MIWDGLTVIGADAPETTGLAISFPFVVDDSRTIRRVSDIFATEPSESEGSVTSDEFETGINIGAWLRTPEWPAQPGYLTLVQGPEFASALDTAAQRDTIDWSILDAGFRAAYLHHETAATWQYQCAEHLIAWGRLQVSDAMANRPVELSTVDATLQRAIFVTDERSNQRMALYTTLGLVIRLMDRTALPVLEEIVEDEFSETSAAFLERLDRLATELEAPQMGGALWTHESAALPPIFGTGFTPSFEPVAVMTEIDGIAA